LNKIVLNEVLDPEKGFEPRYRAILRSKLNLPPETQEEKKSEE